MSPLRHRGRIGFVFFVIVAVAVGVACEADDGGRTEVDDILDSGPPPIRADARTSGPDAGLATSTMRLAHVAAETGPLDFCYQTAQAGTFIGPVLGGPRLPEPDAGADAGDADTDAAMLDPAPTESDAGEDAAVPGLASVSFGAVTKYLVLQSSGPLTIALVEGGAASCANPITTRDITLDPGKLSTVTVFARPSDGGPPALDVAAFTDDRSTTNSTARVRVIHAALGTSFAQPEDALAVRVTASKTTILADRVEPRRAATPSEAVQVDALGYVTAAPVPPPASVAIGPAPTDAGAAASFEPWLSRPHDLGLSGGSLHTAFIVHGPRLPAPPPIVDDAALPPRKSSFRVLWCADTTTTRDRTSCTWLR